ncbi:MAG: phage tail protein [Myxococcota bacterium]|nr:phage tail protein [Myxococcota bacterium]
MGNPTNNYIGNFHFRVHVEGITAPIASFYKVGALTSEEEVVTFMHGGDRAVRKMSGRQDWNDLEMERYYEGIDELYQWRERIVNGHFDHRAVRIDFLRSDHSVLRSMVLMESWPIKWSLPGMNAGSSEVAVETLTIAFDHVIRLA